MEITFSGSAKLCLEFATPDFLLLSPSPYPQPFSCFCFVRSKHLKINGSQSYRFFKMISCKLSYLFHDWYVNLLTYTISKQNSRTLIIRFNDFIIKIIDVIFLYFKTAFLCKNFHLFFNYNFQTIFFFLFLIIFKTADLEQQPLATRIRISFDVS